MRQSQSISKQTIPLILACLVLSSQQCVAEESDILQDFIGQSMSDLIAEIGEPTIRLPSASRYLSEQNLRGAGPRTGDFGPSLGGAGRSSFAGTGDRYEPLHFDPPPCEITVLLDKEDAIKTIEQFGPGCFEFIHGLKNKERDDEQQ